MRLPDDIRAQIREHVLADLATNHLQESANAYIYTEVVPPGTILQDLEREIEVEAPSALVVIDRIPGRNWAHPCEWHLYGAGSGTRSRVVEASFPPYLMVSEDTRFEAISAPVVPVDTAPRLASERTTGAPAPTVLTNYPAQRFAILFSGPSENRHVNDLEFLYRTLLDVYGFEPGNVFVLNHDGTVNYNGGPKPVRRWPGDNTAYRLKVTGQGTRAAMQLALNTIKGRIKESDLLLIHTNGAGAPGSLNQDACLCAYSPSGWAPYYAHDFAADLGTLRAFGGLMVMMEQFGSDGFEKPVLDHSPATSTHICGITLPGGVFPPTGWNFDPFAEHWTAGLAGHYPDGTGLVQPADTTADGRISAAEAFAYAEAADRLGERPWSADRPTGSGRYLFLGQPRHDLFLRDNLTDQGIEPLVGGGISASPDIIVYNEELKDPAATLLTPAARASDTLGETVESGQDNFVYLRVQNRSDEPTSGTAKVYWSPGSTLPRPSSWHLIGEVPIPPVNPGEMAAVGPIVWGGATVPAVGHYCFIGLIDSGGDPAPNPSSIVTIEDYYQFILQSNNATWRNFDVQDMFKDSATTLSFHIQGWPRKALAADLVVDLTALPPTSTVALRILKRLGDGARLENAVAEAESSLWRRYRLTAGRVAALHGMSLQPSEETVATLEITLPEEIDDGDHRLSVAQVVDGQELGRMTMALGVGDHPYLANARTHEVHRSHCVWAQHVTPRHRLAFRNVERAIKHGYNGCRYCLPEYDTDVVHPPSTVTNV